MSKEKFYVVVYVYSGIPTSVKLYHNRRAAEKHEKVLRKEMHPENDETTIFETSVPNHPTTQNLKV